ncbi:MAG TPA: histidine kinase [Gaiellaceae bacterium]|jgi:signal transduction histidine kinase|nr:histidine kinase [Gaiellaceae bacterium]
MSRSRWLLRKDFLVDAGIAAVVFAASVAMLAARGASEGERGLDGVSVAIAALASLPLVARRRVPLGVFVLTASASAILNGLGYPPGPPLGPTVALFFLAASQDDVRASTRITAATVAALFAIHVAAVGLAENGFPTVPVLFGALLWGAAWVAGDRLRMRRLRMAELVERAVRAEHEAERERRLAVAEERTRIARDLHDSAGHAINVILVQAAAARLLSAKDPGRAREALETVEGVARDTLAEIDRLVSVLRENSSSENSGVEPPIGLTALDALAAQHRDAGLMLDVRLHGRPRRLAPAVDRAAYRILQESLTNASRHGSGSAEVELLFGRDGLEITVENPAEHGTAEGFGHGLIGMRERTSLLGGTLEAGLSDGRFRIRAELPYGVGATA